MDIIRVKTVADIEALNWVDEVKKNIRVCVNNHINRGESYENYVSFNTFSNILRNNIKNGTISVIVTSNYIYSYIEFEKNMSYQIFVEYNIDSDIINSFISDSLARGKRKVTLTGNLIKFSKLSNIEKVLTTLNEKISRNKLKVNVGYDNRLTDCKYYSYVNFNGLKIRLDKFGSIVLTKSQANKLVKGYEVQ